MQAKLAADAYLVELEFLHSPHGTCRRFVSFRERSRRQAVSKRVENNLELSSKRIENSATSQWLNLRKV